MSVLPKPSFLTATTQIVPNIFKPAAPACVKQKSVLVRRQKEGFLKLPKAAIAASNSLAGLCYKVSNNSSYIIAIICKSHKFSNAVSPNSLSP